MFCCNVVRLHRCRVVALMLCCAVPLFCCRLAVLQLNDVVAEQIDIVVMPRWNAFVTARCCNVAIQHSNAVALLRCHNVVDLCISVVASAKIGIYFETAK